MKNFIDAQLQDALTQYPDRVAFRSGKSIYTFGQLAHLIPRIATKLRSEGIDSSSRVGVCQASALDYLLTWSLLWLGVTSCSIQKALTIKRGDFGIDWLISAEPVAEFDGIASGNSRSQNLVIDRLWLMEAEAISEPIAAPELNENALARMAMTSGSTGTPKCASFSFEFVVRRASIQSDELKTVVRATFFGPTLWVGFNRLLSSFIDGATMHLLPIDALKNLVESSELGLEEISGSPAQFVSFLQAIEPLAARFWNLKVLRVAGGLLTNQLKDHLLEAFSCDIEVRYSSTETGNVASAVINRSSPDYFVGVLAKGAEVEIVDESGNQVEFGSRGQVRIQKHSMITSYIDRGGEALPALKSSWFYPGDEGSLTANHELFIYGRAGRVKNFGGVKIDLGKVEEFFDAEPGVSGSAALSGFTDALGVERLVLAIERGQGFDRSSTIEKAKNQSFFSSILEILEFDNFPRSEMGKIQKQTLSQKIELERQKLK
jgi:acyl-CoA synthetase (AMP-forming)/AMP-acid ligase II